MSWKPINGRTPRKSMIWLGGWFAGKWCVFLSTETDDVYPKWATHWQHCYQPEDPEQ